jgi:uncharacterized protein (TIGR02646 family)
MIKIKKKSAPASLEELKTRLVSRALTPEEEYKKLKGRRKAEVLNSLMEEQGHICAYCMRTIPDSRVTISTIPDVSIEHWIARNSMGDSSMLGSGLGVEYTNLLAVCSGGKVPRGSLPGNELTCDAKRGNTPLTVNPLKEETLSSIFYKQNGEIAATNPIIERDLVETLNLNCVHFSALPDGRKQALAPIESEIASLASTEDMLNRCYELLELYESETDPKTPYCGIILWWLKDYIKALEDLA